MSDDLRRERQHRARHYGISRKGFYKGEQKRRAKRALKRETQTMLDECACRISDACSCFAAKALA